MSSSAIMLPLTRRLTLVHSLRQLLKTAFSDRYLLATNCVICASLAGAGDLTQQLINWYRRGGSSINNVVGGSQKGSSIISWDRLQKQTLSGLLFGVMGHFWYQHLDRFLPGRCAATVFKKVVIDQLVFSPVWWSTYFAFLGVMERSGWSEFKQRCLQTGKQLYLTEWCLWPPVQLVNFFFLPTSLRVFYISTVTFGIDMYTSHLIYDAAEEAPRKVMTSSAGQNHLRGGIRPLMLQAATPSFLDY